MLAKGRLMKRYGLGLWLALILCGLVSGARADEPIAVEASVRAFGGRERISYAALTLQRKEWTLRGVTAKKSVYSRGADARLLHGGKIGRAHV